MGAMRDRLLLTPERIAAMAAGRARVAALPDPIGETVAEWKRPNGLLIRKVRVPLGVIGIIYESRPNVTVDTLPSRSRPATPSFCAEGKKPSQQSAPGRDPERRAGLPAGAIELLDSTTRDSVQELIQARGLVDVIIPRGGAGLINFVVENSTVPVIETGAGNCHVFVDESANLDMADRIVINAKTQRPSVCNAAEKLLVHENIAARLHPAHREETHRSAALKLRGDEATRKLAPDLAIAPAEDKTGARNISGSASRSVSSRASTTLSLTSTATRRRTPTPSSPENEANARRFLRAVDSATVYWNASTRFSDGGDSASARKWASARRNFTAEAPSPWPN